MEQQPEAVSARMIDKRDARTIATGTLDEIRKPSSIAARNASGRGLASLLKIASRIAPEFIPNHLAKMSKPRR